MSRYVVQGLMCVNARIVYLYLEFTELKIKISIVYRLARLSDGIGCYQREKRMIFYSTMKSIGKKYEPIVHFL